MREKYFDDGRLLKDTMKESRVYVQSTDKNRTKQSATSQMQGLWDKPLTFPELSDEFHLATGIDQDRLVLTSGSNCKRFEQLEHDISKSPEWNELFNEKLPNEYLNENLYDWLREETDS